MRILGFTTEWLGNKVRIDESSGESIESDNPLELFAFLAEPYEDDSPVLRVCWDLNDTFAPIFRLMGRELCGVLFKDKKVLCRPYSLFYIPDKVLTLKFIPVKCRQSFYNLSQYVPSDKPPEDALELEFRGRHIYETLNKMGFYSDTLTSPVRIFEKWVLDHLNIPSIEDIPKEAAEYAWRCGGRLWIEAIKIGYWDKAYDYDLASSFPLVARELIDIRHGKWVKSNQYKPDAYYGYCKGLVTINNNVAIHPIMYEDESGGLSCRTGAWATYLTKGDIDFIHRWGIGKFDISDGWWFIPDRVVKPIEIVVDRLLKWKEDEGLAGELAKRMSVGIYGKFGEEQGDAFGSHWNSVWFAEISTKVKLQVAEAIYKNGLQDNIIAIGVDGLLLNRPIWMGKQWKLAYTGKALVVSSGLVYLAGKKPKGLVFDDVMELIREHPGVGYYEKIVKRRVTLGDALASERFNELGTEKDMYSSIDLLAMERDRNFPKTPQTGRQLLKGHYKSKPFKVDNLVLRRIS